MLIFEVTSNLGSESSEKVAESVEEVVFKTLSHQKRRDILRVIGEKQEMTFTDIKNSIGTEDSPSLSYHLNALKYLVYQKEGKYRLSELGRDTYRLICKTVELSESNMTIRIIRKDLSALVIGNAVLWAAAIFSVSQFQGRLEQMTIYSFSALWFFSNGILYSMLKRTRRQHE